MGVSGTPSLGTQRLKSIRLAKLGGQRSATLRTNHRLRWPLSLIVALWSVEASPRSRPPREYDLSAEEEELAPLPSRRRRRTGEAIPLANFGEFPFHDIRE